MTDILIPLGNGSPWQDNELRYTLRSIEKHLSNVGNVYIVGQRPKFLHGVTHIPFEDTANKAKSIMRKIQTVCRMKSVSRNVLHFHDDHFLLHDANADKFPNYYSGKLADTLKGQTIQGYKVFIQNSVNVLGKEALNYNVHAPMLYSKSKFIKTMDAYDWSARGYVIKSLYANHNNLKGEESADVKINSTISKNHIRTLISGKPFFSIGDGGLSKFMKELLQELYPEKSRWEQ